MRLRDYLSPVLFIFVLSQTALLSATQVTEKPEGQPAPFGIARHLQENNGPDPVINELQESPLSVSGDTGITALGTHTPATDVPLNQPYGVTAKKSGDFLVADTYNHVIRRVNARTGLIKTVAGNGQKDTQGRGSFSGDGGPATEAGLDYPSSVYVDKHGNLLIADTYNHRIRRVNARTGIITTVAGNGQKDPRGFGTFSGDGGPATAAGLNFPAHVIVDDQGNLLIADHFNHRVRRVDAQTGIITTVAGNGKITPPFGGTYSGDGGPATSAGLNSPARVCLDKHGNVLIADLENHRIRRVDTNTGIITTIAGNGQHEFSGDGGPATEAALNYPASINFDAQNNMLIADTSNNRIRRVDAKTGVITTEVGNGEKSFSGDGGHATDAALNEPYDVSVDKNGNLLIADTTNNRIRRVNARGIITTVAGNGE